MRPPINLRSSLRFEVDKLFEDFLSTKFTWDKPVREDCHEKIYVSRRLQKYGYHIQERRLMDTILETLPLSWVASVDKIYHKNNPLTVYELVDLLEEGERKMNPLWIDLEQTRMRFDTPVR